MEKIKYSGIACYNVNVKLGRSELSNEKGVLVLETNHQPDYYAKANFPPNKHQNNWRLFLIVKEHIDCFQDTVLKKAYQINKMLDTNVEINPGQLKFYNKEYQCIRLEITTKEVLGIIIDELKSLGITFLKDKKVEDYQTNLFFKRYTELIEIRDGVCKDIKISGRYFFPIESILELDEFRKGMDRIKHSCNFHLFDSFLSFMFIEGGKGQEFIGIFSNHCDEERFSELKKNIENIFDV